MNLDLNININEVDTSFALIPDRTPVKCVIESTEVKENKAGIGHNLLITFKTAEPVEESTIPGRGVPAGMSINSYYALQPSEKALAAGDTTGWLRRLVPVIDAALGTSMGNRPELAEAVAALNGREVLATVRLEQSEQYGDRNSIGKVDSLA